MKTSVMNMLILSLVVGMLYATAIGQPPPIPAQEQPEVLTRGPVHEAFSEPVVLQAQAGLVVPNQPPADIDEMPPAERPQGDNYVWVPGYWSWDGDRSNYIWVSGCWREAPPNMSWVPGYWSQETDGWEWVAGFWTSADIQNIDYLPAPPEYVDEQPPGPPPSSDDIWVPSCQYWHQDHYVDRPGYWLTANSQWVWTPSHYIWTPRGYIFCDGHWDYPLEDRGVLFAPVYFPPSYYGRSGYSYSPSIVLDMGALTVNLFTYPRYNHYYFGDYYDDSYINIGIYPRYEVETKHTWYDPNFVYDRWRHRDEPKWDDNERHDYDSRRADRNLRPPRTYNDMEARLASKSPQQQQNDIRIAQPLTVVAANKLSPIKFEHIDANAQQKIVTQATAVKTYKAERNQWESTPAQQKTAQPPIEHKGTVTTPFQKNDQMTTPKQKGPATSPGKQRGQMTQPKETTPQPVTPPEQKGSKTPPGNQRGQMTQPNEPKTQPITTPEQKYSKTPPGRQKEQMTQPNEPKNPIISPGEVQMTKPERVKVPAPPIVGKQGAAEKSMPPQPANERTIKGEIKAAPENNQPTGNTKDTSKDTAKNKVKAKGKSNTK